MQPVRARSLAIVLFAMTGCAALHRTQLSDIEPRKGHHISVKVSETTVDLREIASLAKMTGKAFNNKGLAGAGRGLDTYTELFQFGPRTGTPVYNELYARCVPEMLREKCPKGHLANIMSVREAREYPVVKGEIVRIEADCIK